MNALTVHIRGDKSGLDAAINGAQSALKGMASVIAASLAGVVSIAGAFALVKSSISKAAEMEDFQTSFTTLLGSADAAKERLAELAKFGAETPFELPEVVKASKILETLTKGALSTGDGLRLVGDVAASTGEPIEELSVHFGRLYDGLMNGAPVGESMQRLQELGVIGADTRRQIEALQKSGAKGDAVWQVAAASFGRFAGEMERRSKTWNGLFSNLQDAVGSLLREFGTPLMESLKPTLSMLIDTTNGLVPAAQKFGAALGDAVNFLVAAFKEGWIGELLYSSLELGFKKAINFLFHGLQSIGETLDAMALDFAALMVRGLQSGIDAVMDGLRKIPFMDSLIGEGTGSGLLDGFAETLEGLRDEFRAGRDKTDLFDTSGAAKDLSFIVDSIRAAIPKIEAPGAASAAPVVTAAGEVMAGKGSGIYASSLGKIGGGGGYSSAITLQREANSLLKKIERNTMAKPAAGASNSWTAPVAAWG